MFSSLNSDSKLVDDVFPLGFNFEPSLVILSAKALFPRIKPEGKTRNAIFYWSAQVEYNVSVHFM